jgi:hypothetical protein
MKKTLKVTLNFSHGVTMMMANWVMVKKTQAEKEYSTSLKVYLLRYLSYKYHVELLIPLLYQVSYITLSLICLFRNWLCVFIWKQ